MTIASLALLAALVPTQAPAAPATLHWQWVRAVDVDAGAGRAALDIASTVNEAVPRLACRAEADALLRAEDALWLDLAVSLTIAADGTVPRVVPASSSPPLSACLAKALAPLQLAKGIEQQAIVRLLATKQPREPSAPTGLGGVALANQIEVLGSLDAELVRDVVVGEHAGWRRCYDASLAQQPQLFGRVRVSFIVKPSGAVGKVETLQAPPGFDDVSACLAKTLKELTFAKPRNGKLVIVRYPFLFRR